MSGSYIHSQTQQHSNHSISVPSIATATAAGQRDLETRNQVKVLIDLSRPVDLESQLSSSSLSYRQVPSDTTNITPVREMRNERANDHDRSPIPYSTLRNSMNVQRPSFNHTNTEFHTYHQSSSSASLGHGSGSGSIGSNINNNNINNTLPYRDHPSTREEYPLPKQQQSFPPRQSRRSGPIPRPPVPNSGNGTGNVWDSTRCRLLDFKCRLCSREGAIGRGLMIGWVLTTLGFLTACAFWKGELFTALDELSQELYKLGYQGQIIFGLLIFLTTIPPLPLYSTLMVLCGYTFGVWEGFVVSYIASLTGAIVVFIVSRTLLRDVITKSLQNSPMAISLLHIIPSNPHLLLLIRIAPYPYNLLNVILASSPALTLRTYTACTALSLCKLFLHTWIGAGLHSLSELHGTSDEPLSEEDQQRQDVRWYSTCFGVVLCISLFFYLTHLAKRALARAQVEHEAREIRCPGQGHVFLREEEA